MRSYPLGTLVYRAGLMPLETVNKAQFNTGGANGDQFDPEAYAQGLFTQVNENFDVFLQVDFELQTAQQAALAAEDAYESPDRVWLPSL